ncbi:hypothetical protein, partial [Achromobacter sp.]|uniref:hypothetical protein n=1 Tax=Achromobacter sp. TaxID=134375 RepID=UPI0028AAB1AC
MAKPAQACAGFQNAMIEVRVSGLGVELGRWPLFSRLWPGKTPNPLSATAVQGEGGRASRARRITS